MVKIKWHLHPKQAENRVDSYHDSDRDEKNIHQNIDGNKESHI